MKRVRNFVVFAASCLLFFVGCGSSSPNGPGNGGGSASGPSVFLVIHADPNRTTTANFDMLKDLFKELAERQSQGFAHHFTVLFTPEWSPYVLQEQQRIDEVASWVAAGHELGLHHHTAPHFNADGYADALEDRVEMACCKYRMGCTKADCSIADMVTIMRQLVEHPEIAGTLRSLRSGPETSTAAGFENKEYYGDVTADFEFSTKGYEYDDGSLGWYEDGGTPDPQRLIGNVDCWTQPDWPNARSGGVKAAPHAQYYSEQEKENYVPLDVIEDAIDLAGGDDTIGVVWHENAYDIAQGKPRVDALLDALQTRGLLSRTVSETLEPAGCAR